MPDDPSRERLIHKVLEQQVAKHGNRTFLYFKDEAFGYQDFDQAANRVACGLQELGIEKGDKVAIMMNNCPEFLFLWFGLSKLGAVEVPINTAHKGELLVYFLDFSDTSLLVIDRQYLDQVEPILNQAPKIKKVIIFGQSVEGMPKLDRPVLDWSQIIDNDGRYQSCDVLWSDPFGILFTSGTTGPSKGALMPQNYALFMGESVIQSVAYDEQDCLYNALPLFHGNAQVLSFMPALMSGARTVLAERFSASKFWDDVRRYGCTEFNYIGSIVPILCKADPKPDDADNPLQKMFGAAAPKDLFEAFEKRFSLTLIEGYGMVEIGMPLLSNFRARRPGSCGKPFPDYAVKLVDDNGLEVGPHAVGEILVRPLKPYCMKLEYYKMAEKTVEAWRNLWFHTGDYARCDEDGFFYFVDRKKDALRRRGENISSYEVEKVVNSHEAILESAAVAMKSELGEDDIMICLMLKPGRTLTPEALIAFCNERMAYFMVPRYVRIMDQLPKTATQRTQKAELRKQGITPDTWDREGAGKELKR